MGMCCTGKQSFRNCILDALMITNPVVLSPQSFCQLSTPTAPSQQQGYKIGVQQNVPVKVEAQSPQPLCSSSPCPPARWVTTRAQPWVGGRSLTIP